MLRLTSSRFVRVASRRYSTTTKSRSVASHLFAGLIGGSIVVAGAYGYYHFSGIREKVESAQRLVESFRPQTKRVHVAIDGLRQNVRSYFSFIPGMGLLVDKAFGELDKLAAKSQHMDAVEKHIERAVAEISDVLQTYGADRNKEAAIQICNICLRLGRELANEAGQAAAPAIEGMVQGANAFISKTSGLDTKYHEAKAWVHQLVKKKDD